MSVLVVLRGATLSAQSDAAVVRAADVITADAIGQHLNVIAADSMAGRALASRGLTQTAQYIADQFQRFGLEPGQGAWLQEYFVAFNRVALDRAGSRLVCAAMSRPGTAGARSPAAGRPATDTTTVTFASEAYVPVDTMVETDHLRTLVDSSAVLVAGRQTAASVARADLRGRVVLYLPAPDVDSATERQVLHTLYAVNRVLVLSRADSATFTRRQQAAAARWLEAMDPDHPTTPPDALHHWAVTIRPAALRSCLDQAGVDIPHELADTKPIVRELPRLRLQSVLQVAQVVPEIGGDLPGVNVIGLLPGRGLDSATSTEPGAPEPDAPEPEAAKAEGAIVILAHMDDGGVGHGPLDRFGVDDNGSGVAAMLAIARAFGQLSPSARPRRSIVFLATSGEGYGWGSRAWLNAALPVRAAINLDRLGRPAGDSVWVDGVHEVNWPVRPDWLAALHPELGLTVVSGGSIARPVSDHFVFVRQLIPSLYVYDGNTYGGSDNGDGAVPASDSTTRTAVAPASIARIAKLVFYLAVQLSEEPQRLAWTAEGRQALFDYLGSP